MQLKSLQAAIGVKEVGLLIQAMSASATTWSFLSEPPCHGNDRLELAFWTFGFQIGCYHVSKRMDAFESKSATSQVASNSLFGLVHITHLILSDKRHLAADFFFFQVLS